MLYGAGEYFATIRDNFNISKLNIVGIADKKFEKNKNNNTSNYPAIAPKELKDFDCDLILITTYNFFQIYEYLKYQILINSKNQKVKIKKIVRPTFLYFLKSFIS